MSRQQIYLAIIGLGVIYALVWGVLQMRGGSDAASRAQPAAATDLRPQLENVAAPPAERARTIDIVGAQRDTESMPQLLKLLDDPDSLVRARAGVAVTKILHADFYFRADDPPNIRREAIARIRAHWEAWKAKGLPGAK